MGTALLRPHAGGVVPGALAGASNEEMQRWLRSCLDLAKAATSALMKSAPSSGVKPALFLHPQTPHLSGLWIVGHQKI